MLLKVMMEERLCTSAVADDQRQPLVRVGMSFRKILKLQIGCCARWMMDDRGKEGKRERGKEYIRARTA